jgi:Fic family protein
MAQYSPEVQTLLNRINDLQSQIEALRPIKPELISRIFQKYRLDWNYNSNSIEGNSLNYGETVAFIMEGLTAKGKPLKDHLDIKGHNDAIDFLMDMQRQGNELMERDIRSLHEMILVEPYQSKAQTADGQSTTKTIQLGVYKSSPNHVVTRTGEIHYYATPEETPAKMHDLMSWYRENWGSMHPLVLSTLFHHRFVAIHPFDDGNGRMSRLLSNLILMQAGMPPVVVRQDQKSEYYGVLSQADAGITDPLLEYFASLLLHSLNVYLKGAQGEDISELNDLDKEMSLFIAGFDEEDISKVPFDEVVAKDIAPVLFNSYFEGLIPRLRKMSGLFFNTDISINIDSYDVNNRRHNKSEYQKMSSEGFYDSWGKGALISTFLEEVRVGMPKDGSIRVVLSFEFSGFKAKETADVISIISMIDFERSYYSFMPFALGETQVETYSGRIETSYPKVLAKTDWQELYGQFFRGLMAEINKAYIDSAE